MFSEPGKCINFSPREGNEFIFFKLASNVAAVFQELEEVHVMETQKMNEKMFMLRDENNNMKSKCAKLEQMNKHLTQDLDKVNRKVGLVSLLSSRSIRVVRPVLEQGLLCRVELCRIEKLANLFGIEL